MKVSFKLTKKGSRYVPKPADNPANVSMGDGDKGDDVQPMSSSVQPSSSSAFTNHNVADAREDDDGISDLEVSFTLNIFPDGYTIVNPSEPMAQGIPEFFLPYNRASDNLFSAIECGHIPGDLPDDIPCKYINGTIICEVRDYRNCFSKPHNVPSGEASPIVNKVRLKMSLGNVVKDLSQISDTTWTYQDYLDAESRVVNALHPKLFLHPTPDFERLCSQPNYSKLNLSNLRQQRLRRASQVVVGSTTSIQGTDMVPESSDSRLANSESARLDQVVGSVSSAPATSHSGNELLTSYTNTRYCSSVYSIHGKRGSPSGPLYPSSCSSKKAKATPQMNGFIGPNSHQRNAVLSPQQMFEGSSQQSLLSQRPPLPFSQNRKAPQCPHVSAGPLPHSPLSSMSREFSSGSMRAQFGRGVSTAGIGSSQKGKQQQQAQMGKQRSDALPKTAAMNTAKIRASVGNMSVPLNTRSSVGSPPMADQGMLKKFSNIVAFTSRFQLNIKKKKVDQLRNVKRRFQNHQLKYYLSNNPYNRIPEDEECTMPMSKSVVGGSVNIPKVRILSFVQLEKSEGSESQTAVPESRTKLIMSHKGNDGTVAMLYGKIEEAGDYLAVEDSLPVLTNSHNADVLAAEMCRQILREGYHLEGDEVQPKPAQMRLIPIGQPNNTEGEMQPVAVEDVAQPSSCGYINNRLTNSPQKKVNTENSEASHISQGRSLPEVSIPLSRPQHHHYQQQQHHEQRKMMMGQTSSQQTNSVALPPLPQSALMASNKKMTQGEGADSQMQLGGSSGASILAQPMSHASSNNMNLMQRSLMGPMAPPNLMSNVNHYMNQHQQQQQMNLLQKQQEMTRRPSQSVVLPPQQGASSSSVGMAHQRQACPQQLIQQWTSRSEQISSGGSHRSIGAGNQDGNIQLGRQLNSQTMGSVGNITHSPMEKQSE